MASSLEDQFLVLWCERHPHLPAPEEQFTEIPPWLEHLEHRKLTESSRCRKWQADFVFVEARLIVEISGGLYAAKSGHTTAKGVERDYAKSVVAAAGGWLCLHLAGSQLTPYFIDLIASMVVSRMQDSSAA